MEKTKKSKKVLDLKRKRAYNRDNKATQEAAALAAEKRKQS